MTTDKDFKALIRERMGKTGESYTTARAQLLRQQQSDAPETDPQEPDGPAVAFALASPESVRRARSVADDVAGRFFAETGVEIVDEALHVWMGQPRAFEITIPLGAIRSARRVPDKTPGGSLGVHGARGRWLVNASYDNLVALDMDPAQKAVLRVSSSLPPAVREKMPWFVRPLLRDRSPKVRELTLSVEEPEALLAALSNHHARR